MSRNRTDQRPSNSGHGIPSIPSTNLAAMSSPALPERIGSPKSQLHNAIDTIQSLHKRKNALKATYDHERSDLTTRNEKSKQALEGLIFSTEEQIQSIGEIPYPDFADVKIKLHQVMKDAEALYDNVASLDQSMNVALDSWFRKENERTIGEIKAAELGYKRSFDAWHDGIRSGQFFESEPPKPQSSGQQSQQSPIHLNPDYMPSSVKVNGPDVEPMQMDREPVYSGKQEESQLSNSGLAKSNSKSKRSTLAKIESIFKPDAGKRRTSYSSAS